MSGQEVFVQRAADFVHGALYLEEDGAWVRPWRVTPEQYRALSCAAAWHPGLFKQMAACTAGVVLEFETTAQGFVLEVELDDLPQGSKKSLELVAAYEAGLQPYATQAQVKLEGRGFYNPQGGSETPDMRLALTPYDALTLEVDGQFKGNLHPEYIKEGSTQAHVQVQLQDSSETRGFDLSFAGMEFPHRVRIQLPVLRGLKLKNLVSFGAPVMGVAHKQTLLVLGDSIAQGFVAGGPNNCWPRLVADALDLELVNQGIGGHVVQPNSLPSAQAVANPARIVVALGANYRYEPYREEPLRRDVERYVTQISSFWHKVPCWVITPFWHEERLWPTHAKSVFGAVPQVLAQATSKHDHMGLVDGLTLIDHESSLFADGFEHPNAAGNAQIADRLLRAMGEPGLKSKVQTVRTSVQELSQTQTLGATPQGSASHEGSQHKAASRRKVASKQQGTTKQQGSAKQRAPKKKAHAQAQAQTGQMSLDLLWD